MLPGATCQQGKRIMVDWVKKVCSPNFRHPLARVPVLMNLLVQHINIAIRGDMNRGLEILSFAVETIVLTYS